MKYLSVCSGIEAATVAWRPLGWSPAGFSEIDPFASAVLAHHYPNTSNRGDMNRFREWRDVSTFDVLVGGTPCQSFSVAGLRAGLADPRGNLSLVYLGILDLYRPRWFVWENVPGALSSVSDDGDETHAFAKFLAGFQELGYRGAYRTFNARHFGVPQHRRRVVVVGHLGDWAGPAEVLFEPESLQGYSAARERQTMGSPASAPGGPRRSDRRDVVSTNRLQAFGRYTEDSVASAVLSRDFKYATDLIVESSASKCLEHGKISRIRRYTPLETERLQGFPDHYTDISKDPGAARFLYGPERILDRHRYRVLGNSMPVPLMRWIGERIERVERFRQGA